MVRRAPVSRRRSRSAALSVVAALSLGRVVDSSRFVLPVVGAALLPHALGALVRWRGWSVWVGGVLAAARAGRLRGGRARAVDHHLRTPGGRHLARDRDAALRRMAPPAHRTRARADHRRRHPARGARGVGDGRAWPTGSRSAVRPRWRPRHRRSCSSCGRRRSAPTTRRSCSRSASASPPARSSSRRTSRCSTSAAAGWCRNAAPRPHWLAPAALLGSAAIVVALVVAPLVPGVRRRPAPRRRRQRPRRFGWPQLQAVDRPVLRHRPQARRRAGHRPVHGEVERARLLAHRGARPVLGRRGRAVDAERRGRRQREGGAARDRTEGHARTAVHHRSARGALAARRVPPGGHRPARHAGGRVLGHHRRRRRRGVGPRVHGALRPAPARGHAVHRRGAGGHGGAAAAAGWRVSRPSRTPPTSNRSRRSPSAWSTTRARPLPTPRRRRCATTSATTTASCTTRPSGAATTPPRSSPS